MSLSSALFPAAQTKMMPAFPADCMASISACEKLWLPKLALSTPAPWAMAYSMQGSSAVVDPAPVPSMNSSSISCTDQATPQTPRLLLPTAPTIPDTCVPWPAVSVGGPVIWTAFRPLTSSVSLIISEFPLASCVAYDFLVYGLGFVQRLAARY